MENNKIDIIELNEEEHGFFKYEYFKNNLRHREEGPALYYKNIHNQTHKYEWWEENKLIAVYDSIYKIFYILKNDKYIKYNISNLSFLEEKENILSNKEIIIPSLTLKEIRELIEKNKIYNITKIDNLKKNIVKLPLNHKLEKNKFALKLISNINKSFIINKNKIKKLIKK